MDDKQMSKRLFKIVIIATVCFTLISLVVLNLMAIKSGQENLMNKIPAMFTLFVFIYAIMLYIIPILVKRIEKEYIAVNEKYDTDMEIEYYRELVENYSIGALVKCYGEKVNYRDQLVATLLRLSLNEKIKMDEERIQVIEEEGLSPTEFLFVKSCKNCKIYTKNNVKSLLEKDNVEDALQTDLFSKNTVTHFGIKDKTLRFGVILGVLNFIALILTKENSGNSITVLSFIAECLLVSGMILAALRERTVLYRTEKGKEIQQKLKGLKRFLTDYSSIADKKVEAIKIWDEYIIYAILFNMKGKLNLEAYNIYKKYIDKLIF